MSPRQVKPRSVRWDEKAACSGLSPSLFFPSSEEALESGEAKKICTSCPVRDQCLEEAILNREHGIWGGTTFKERERIRRTRARDRKVKPEEGRSTERDPPRHNGGENGS